MSQFLGNSGMGFMMPNMNGQGQQKNEKANTSNSNNDSHKSGDLKKTNPR